jgi:alpha-L-rhamnosidase
MARINRRRVLMGTGLLAAAPILLRPSRARGAEGDTATPEAQALRAVRLRVEYIERPLGLEVARPRLSWACTSRARGAAQSAYRITAASSREHLEAGNADLWDSGVVRSGRCFEVRYGGRMLRSAQRVWWRVQVWDAHERPSPPSEPAWFEMGLLQPSDWRAQWLDIENPDERADRAAGIHWIWSDAPPLAPEPQQFRHRFTLPAGVRQAQLWLSAKDDLLGVWIDGVPAALPAERPWGSMQRISLPVTPGAHLIAVSGRADPGTFMPGTGGALAALVKVWHTDGTIERFTSGPDWRTSRTAPAGWTQADFDDGPWPRARAAATSPPCDPRPPRPAMLARRDFIVAKPLARARLYATALGAYEPHINGERLGTARLAPQITVAGDHVLYQCHDATDLLRPGRNALGALIGDGWYASAFTWMDERYSLADSPRRFLAQLVLEYSDGSRDVIVTDSSWRLANSMILSSQIYDGENYDARLERRGWDEPGYDATDWQVAAIGVPPRERLVAQVDPPIRALQTLAVRTITQPRPGVYVCDLGQNFAGWCRLRVTGPAGTTVRLRHAEILYPDGNINTSNLRAARATDHYTLRGDPLGETYEPHFTYHGFRYVEITGFPGVPTRETIEGVVAHTAAAETGALELKQPIAQQIWHNALWSQRSNFFGVPTDCPQRDERMGWMGDIQVFLDAAAFNMDVDAFIRRFLLEVRAGQTADGAFPIVTPQPRSFPELVSAGWSDAGVILPWTLYRRYGDSAVIEENWPHMQRWLEYVGEANPDFLWRRRRGLDLGDWLSVVSTNPDVAPNPAEATTPKMLVATAYWARCAALMAEMAGAIGHTDEAERYARLRQRIAQAFAREFVRSDGTVGNGSQTSYALSLRFGLVPAALRTRAGERLAADVGQRGNLLSTGFLGTPCLLDALADNGQRRLAITLLLQTQYPSWGYMIEHGATTMWERWNGNAVDQSMNSFNHYALGAVVGFMYRRVGGIDEAAPGFRRIRIDPIFDARIARVRARYESCLGPISTELDGDARGLTRLRLCIPANSRAEVHLPGRPLEWRADGRPLRTAVLRALSSAPGAFIAELDSGTYELTRD